MLEISSKTNLLEQKSYKYSLQDVAEPNLQRDVYSYGTIPKVAFNHRRVPMSMPEEIWITDTSLRDGQQSVEPYSVDQIVNIYKLLSKLGGPYGIIRQTEFFVYSKKDREAIEKCMALNLKFPEITSWIRATKEDFQLVHDLGIKETGILVSCSDYHIFKKMKMTRKQAMDYYLATVEEAFNAGVIPRCHLEDITRADFYGFVVPFVNELMELSHQAKIPVRIRACDTMGYGVPYPETMDTLEELHRMGLKVALITNGNPVLQRQKISHFGFDTVCDAIAIGGKPEKRVFLDMAETLGAKPGELLYVGDHPLNDIQGSRDAGYVPVWIRTMPWDYPEVERAPWEIGNVSELPCLIRARFS